jgi:hypothetical protein
MGWRPTKRQVLLAIGVVIALLILLLIGVLLWRVLAGYIQPKTPTNKKDLVNIFVVIAAGVVGSLTAIAAVGNFYISRRNLQQQRILEEQRAQKDRDLETQRAHESALQKYLEQVGMLLIQHPKPADFGTVARAQTLAVLKGLRGDRDRKRVLMLFLSESKLLDKNRKDFCLRLADLSDADLRCLQDEILSCKNLSQTHLERADLGKTDLQTTDLTRAYLMEANLVGADLSGADLSGADLTGADLTGAIVTKEQLSSCKDLSNAFMPDGQKYEEWLKDKERRGKGTNNTDSS